MRYRNRKVIYTPNTNPETGEEDGTYFQQTFPSVNAAKRESRRLSPPRGRTGVRRGRAAEA